MTNDNTNVSKLITDTFNQDEQNLNIHKTYADIEPNVFMIQKHFKVKAFGE